MCGKNGAVVANPTSNNSQIKVIAKLPDGRSLDQTFERELTWAAARREIASQFDLLDSSGSEMTLKGIVRGHYVKPEDNLGDIQLNAGIDTNQSMVMHCLLPLPLDDGGPAPPVPAGEEEAEEEPVDPPASEQARREGGMFSRILQSVIGQSQQGSVAGFPQFISVTTDSTPQPTGGPNSVHSTSSSVSQSDLQRLLLSIVEGEGRNIERVFRAGHPTEATRTVSRSTPEAAPRVGGSNQPDDSSRGLPSILGQVILQAAGGTDARTPAPLARPSPSLLSHAEARDHIRHLASLTSGNNLVVSSSARTAPDPPIGLRRLSSPGVTYRIVRQPYPASGSSSELRPFPALGVGLLRLRHVETRGPPPAAAARCLRERREPPTGRHAIPRHPPPDIPVAHPRSWRFIGDYPHPPPSARP
eukprot:GHVH01017150.1.p1 GENE.GHVH01017150.1~~GHVH01017150.1.p1  ORF type:complete len:416 (+),score=41.85 GHVH01017150.1:126-1373(+)